MSRDISFDRKKKELEKYITLKYRYEKSERELIKLSERKETITGVKAITYDDMPKGGKPVLFTDLIDDLVDLEKIARNHLARAERRKEKIEMAIDEMENEELKTILEMKYIEDFSYAKIGHYLNYDKSTIFRKCNSAIRLINL